jgi:uncharacterized protein
MSSYVTPGVYFETPDRDARPPVALRTDIAGFTGVAAMGPLDQPVRLTSWRQFESVFGGIDADAYLGYAVKAFFENGGRVCWVVRVASPPSETVPADPSRPASGPPDLGGSSTVVPASGFVPGAVVTVLQEDIPVAPLPHVVAAVEQADSRIVWDSPLEPALWLDCPLIVERVDGAVRTLTSDEREQPADRKSSIVRSLAGFEPGTAVRISQTQRRRVRNHRLADVDLGGARLTWEVPLAQDVAAGPLSFAAGPAAAETVLANWGGDEVLRAAASSPGAWGNNLRLFAATSGAGATRTTAAPQPRDRRSSLVGDVSALQRGDLVRITQPGARPATAYLVVASVDARSKTVFWGYVDRDGRFSAEPLPSSFDLRRPLALERVDLSLSVYRDGQLLQLLPALSLVPEHPRYAPEVIAAETASLIAVDDLTAGGPVSAQDLVLPMWDRWLEGGRDGVAALTPDDVIGHTADAGIGALAFVDEVAVLAAPDAFIRPGPEPLFQPVTPCPVDPCVCEPPTPLPAIRPAPVEHPPTFGPEEAFRIQSALVEQCEALRDRFAVLDAPPQRSRSAVEAGAVAREWRKRFETQFAALYLPWLRARDPGGAAGLRELPPCGHVCGLYARFDLAEGVHFPPANGDLRWVHDVVARIDQGLHGVLNQEGINAIRVFPGKGVLVYGARTMSSDPLWWFVNVRRLLSMIEKALGQACQWAVFEPHTLQLRSLMRLNVVSFLEAMWEAGGLVGDTPDEAFRVICDQTNNPAAVVDAGELVTDVLVAPVVPGEFIVLRIGRVDGQIEIAELGRGGVLANVAAA